MASSVHDTPQANYRRLRCTIIGAGVSGILMGYKLQKYLKHHVDLVILEKSPELGGTWYENQYPGCACDVPSHCYQYSFAPNPEWSKLYVSSAEIQSYLKGVAQHFDLERLIRYNSQVTSAVWSAQTATWTVELEGRSPVVSDVLVNACGILNNYKMPDIEGLSSFRGPVLHTADWDPSVDVTGKHVAVIGSGASGIQVLPQVQPRAAQVQVYIRTPTWISPPMGVPEGVKPSHRYSEDEKLQFREDPAFYLGMRKEIESQFNGMYKVFFKSSYEQKNARDRLSGYMRGIICEKTLQDRLIPQFEMGCRRTTPGEPFLHALQKPNVEPVFGAIERVSQEGVVAGGVLRKADILIAATGFDTSFRPRFPIIGLDGVNLQDTWKDIATSYMGTGVAGFPNYLIFLGPNTPISNGSAMGEQGPIEATSDYFVRLLRKMVRQQVKSFRVKPECQEDFDAHTQNMMPAMVWTGSCRSWFKQGTNGKVTALWPGSALHYMQVLAEDRWEDYEWEYKYERYAYWSSGFSWIEDPSGDPLGLQEQGKWKMSTVPRPGADLSFYLADSEPLPRGICPEWKSTDLTRLSHDGSMETEQPQCMRQTERGAALTVTTDPTPAPVAV